MNENRNTNVIGDEVMVPMEMIKSIDRMVYPTGIKDYTKRVLIENFLKKENEERGKKYEDILKKKYEVLEQLRDELKLKEGELATAEKEMKELNIHKLNLENLSEIKVNLEKQIEEIKNEISGREEEIKVIEKYWKKSEAGEILEKESEGKEKLDWQVVNSESAEECSVDVGLTEEEQQEYTKLINLEAMWKGMWKELPENLKHRLKELDAKNDKRDHVEDRPEDSSSFQDGEAVLNNGGENNFQDEEAVLNNGGESGLPILTPGMYRINPILFQIKWRWK